MTLSDDQIAALRNLSRKSAGEDVDWINISDARALSELGLAQRSRNGWDITPAGAAVLEAAPVPASDAETPPPQPFR